MSMYVNPNNPTTAPNTSNKKLPQKTLDTGGVIFGEGTLRILKLKKAAKRIPEGCSKPIKNIKQH